MNKILKRMPVVAVSALMTLNILSGCDSKKGTDNGNSSDDASEYAVKGDYSDVDGKKDILSEEIRLASRNLPLPAGDFADITRLEYDRDADLVLFQMDITDSDIAKGMEMMKGGTKDTYLAMLSTDDCKPLMQMMADAEAAMRLVITFEGRSLFDERFSTLEINDMAMRDDSESDLVGEALQSTVAQMKKSLPVRVDEITTMTDVSFDGACFTYHYTVDESNGFDVSSLDTGYIKSVLKDQLHSNTAASQFVSLLKQGNIHTKYVYRGSETGKCSTITISPDEM